jgi:hypothetical protein
MTRQRIWIKGRGRVAPVGSVVEECVASVESGRSGPKGYRTDASDNLAPYGLSSVTHNLTQRLAPPATWQSLLDPAAMLGQSCSTKALCGHLMAAQCRGPFDRRIGRSGALRHCSHDRWGRDCESTNDLARRRPQVTQSDALMSNSFAFGGTKVVLLACRA